MSVIQSSQNEIRFLKRKNLEEEARVYGNMLADQIRQYGVDCTYYKMNTDVFGDFKGTIDRNAVLKKAYNGYDFTPDYTCSAEMITYPEVHTDIFQLNKYGIIPEAEIDFNFDARQFACDLAVKCGQLKEYTIDKTPVMCEIPACISDELENSAYEYCFGLGYNQTYTCGILSGKLSAVINEYEYDKEYTIVCHPYEHSDFKVEFPKNSDLYASLTYSICNDAFLDTLLYLTFKVNRVFVSPNTTKSILSGYLHGSVLFYDTIKLGKYIEQIHPEVGDIIMIDFPDDASKEKYQITDCYDKSLQSDGISPLLHKYIWKCKAKRYVDSYDTDDQIIQNEDDERQEEKIKHDLATEEEISKKISKYDECDQEAYGGYSGIIDTYDKQVPNPYKQEKYDYLADGTCLDIMTFDVGSKLITNGYDLIFVTKGQSDQPGDGYVVAKMDHEPTVRDAYFESGLRWLKATNEKIVFVNIEGQSTCLAEDDFATKGEIQMCLNDLNEKTLDIEAETTKSGNILTFRGTRSYIWTDGFHLYAKLQSNESLYKLV